MSLNTWSRDGSEKAQASQTIRMLMKTLQYLAEDAATDENSERSFLNVASAVIKNTFSPSTSFSVNEQVSVVFNAMGWKNTQITLTSANEADILLGSNRHLDQDPDSEQGLMLLVKLLAQSLGSHIFDRDVNAVVDIDIHSGPTYRVTLKAIQNIETHQSQKKQMERMSSTTSSLTPAAPTSTPTQMPPITPHAGGIETSQIFLPVLNNRLPTSRLHLILQDVLAEFCSSWYGENPLTTVGTSDENENVMNLITFLTNKASENDSSMVEIGGQIGNYFGQALMDSFSDQDLLSSEILEGSAVGSIIRDIKARSFCYLKPGDKCGPNIGDGNREICDFVMGLWGGFMSKIEGTKQFKFSGFYPAGRRDPYCLMEFEVN